MGHGPVLKRQTGLCLTPLDRAELPFARPSLMRNTHIDYLIIFVYVIDKYTSSVDQ
jgi:hypothetical protein